MGRPSKFTAARRETILKALKIGASHRTAAAMAGVDSATFRRWIEKGKTTPGGEYAKFVEECEIAEAEPKIRALAIVQGAMNDRPDLAWKFIERRESGYAPPQATPVAAPAGPVVIQLSLSDGRPLVLGETTTVIEVGDEQYEEAGQLTEPTPISSA